MNKDKEYIVLKDANGLIIPFTRDDLMAQLCEIGTQLLGMDFNVVLEFLSQYQKAGQPMPPTVESVQRYFHLCSRRKQ